MKDYELPEINEDISGVDLLIGGPSSNDDQQQNKKYQELINEQSLLREEHKSNIKELNTKIGDMEIQLRFKNEKQSELQKHLLGKDGDMSKMRLDIEKLMKNLKDSSLDFSMGQRMNEETIARKTKEVESLMREKKCKNCVICLEDLKDKQDYHLIQDLNDRLMIKSKRID